MWMLWMFYLNTSVDSTHEGQKWVWDLLELELQRIMSYCVDAGTQTLILCQSRKWS